MIDSWALTTLGEVTEIRSGYGFPKRFQGRTSGDLPFAKVGDISAALTAGVYEIAAAANYIDESELGLLKVYPVPKGSTVFAKIGEAIRLNRRAITTRDLVVDNNVMALVPNTDTLTPMFLLYFMNTQNLYELSAATTVPSLRKSEISQIPISLPPINEQRRIVNKIERLQRRTRRARASLDAIPPLLEKFRQSVLAAAFRVLMAVGKRTYLAKSVGSAIL